MKIPILKCHRARVSQAAMNSVRQLAAEIVSKHPQLNREMDQFNEHVIDEEVLDAPTLHLDDFSEIPVIGKSENSRVLQQRARLRACDGDWVAQSRKIERGFSDYCEYHLGLGRVKWVYPAVADSNTRQIALECWQDRRLRHDLEQAVRHDGLRYIHPHVSTRNVWELAALLQGSTRMPISVVGPTPALANWANDKIEFTNAAQRLLGEEFVPRTDVAYNFAALAKTVKRLAIDHQKLGIKFPYGTGGAGNFLIDAKNVRGKSLIQIRNYLKEVLQNVRWPKNGRVLVDVWEVDVVASPSVQTWIPPKTCGEPVIEGLFIQSLSSDKGQFKGSCLAELPVNIEQQIVDQGYLLASLLQELGYVGRCSFDLILVGENTQDCRVEYIECNARWGGTSSPMTLINRLELNEGQTYQIQQVDIADVWQMEFAELERELSSQLYNPLTGHGDLVLFNPARIENDSAIEVIAIGNSQQDVLKLLNAFSKDVRSIVINHLEPHSVTGFLLDHGGFDEMNSNS